MMNIDLNIWDTHFKYDDNEKDVKKKKKKAETSQHKKMTENVLKSQQKEKLKSYMSDWTIIRKFQQYSSIWNSLFD